MDLGLLEITRCSHSRNMKRWTNKDTPTCARRVSLGELPLAARRSALDAATIKVGNECGLMALKPLSFGLPVFEAFGLNRREASRHAHSKLLLTQGIDVSLEYANW